jgi:hypothetical protein
MSPLKRQKFSQACPRKRSGGEQSAMRCWNSVDYQPNLIRCPSWLLAALRAGLVFVTNRRATDEVIIHGKRKYSLQQTN